MSLRLPPCGHSRCRRSGPASRLHPGPMVVGRGAAGPVRVAGAAGWARKPVPGARPVQMCFQQGAAQNFAGREAGERNSGAPGFARAVAPKIVQARVVAPVPVLLAGLAAVELEVWLGTVDPEEPVPVRSAVLAQVVALAAEAVELCPGLRAWSGYLTEVRPHHWSPVPQPAHWPVGRNVSPAGQARWVERCSICSLRLL